MKTQRKKGQKRLEENQRKKKYFKKELHNLLLVLEKINTT